MAAVAQVDAQEAVADADAVRHRRVAIRGGERQAFGETQGDGVILALQRVGANAGGERAQPDGAEQRRGGRGRRAEAVVQVGADAVEVCGVFDGGELLIDGEAQVDVFDVRLGDVGDDGKVHGDRWAATDGLRGAAALRQAQLLDGLIHGHRVDLVGEDDGGTEQDVAVVAANLLLARPRLVAIVGPVFSATAVATIDIYSAAGVIMISGSASRTDLTLTQSEPGFFFRTAFTNAVEGPRQAEILIERLATGTAFIIDDREAYGIDLAQSAVAPLREAGWEVVRESVPQGTVDFSELVGRIVAADPAAVVFEGFNPEGALLLRQLRDGGYGGLFLAGDGVVSQSGFIGVLGDVAEGAILTGCPDTLGADFLRLWQSGGSGAVPSIPFLGSTADAAFLLIDAVARVAEPQPDGSLLIHPLKLRDAIAATQTVGWASGRQIAFDQHGDRVGSGADAGLVSCEVRDGAFVEIAS